MNSPKLISFVCLLCGALSAQTVQPVAQQTSPEAQVPLYSITVVGKSVDAVNYHTLGRQTKILFDGTPLLPAAKGSAEVEVIRGATRIKADFKDVAPAQRFGPEYLTYVLWAITPDGRATSLGEVQLRGTSSRLNVTTPLQNFGLVVTAEPYFAVTRPGDLVVMQNLIRPETVGAIHPIQARYGLLQRGQYTRTIPRGEVTLLPQDPKVPLDYYEAENAVRIARWAGAAQYAPDIFARAEQQLQQAQGLSGAQRRQKTGGHHLPIGRAGRRRCPPAGAEPAAAGSRSPPSGGATRTHRRSPGGRTDRSPAIRTRPGNACRAIRKQQAQRNSSRPKPPPPSPAKRLSRLNCSSSRLKPSSSRPKPPLPSPASGSAGPTAAAAGPSPAAAGRGSAPTGRAAGDRTALTPPATAQSGIPNPQYRPRAHCQHVGCSF